MDGRRRPIIGGKEKVNLIEVGVEVEAPRSIDTPHQIGATVLLVTRVVRPEMEETPLTKVPVAGSRPERRVGLIIPGVETREPPETGDTVEAAPVAVTEG